MLWNSPGRLTKSERTEAARQLWAEIYPELSEGKSGLVGALTARSEAQVLRLSCIYALLESFAACRCSAPQSRA